MLHLSDLAFKRLKIVVSKLPNDEDGAVSALPNGVHHVVVLVPSRSETSEGSIVSIYI